MNEDFKKERRERKPWDVGNRKWEIGDGVWSLEIEMGEAQPQIKMY